VAGVVVVSTLLGCSSSDGGGSPPPGSPAKALPGSPGALLSAAFAEFARSGDAYAELHHRYLGVTQPPPDTSSCASWPAASPGVATLRMGFVSEEPLHTVGADGQHRGFEAELGAELVRRVNAHYPGAGVVLEWVRVDVTLPVGPTKNSTELEALAGGLRGANFDVAFSSVVPVESPDIAYLCPTMTMFPGVVYTGRDGLDTSGIHDRATLVAFLVAHPGMTFVHGAGVSVYDALVADVATAGGAISLAVSGTTPHFRMADILGLTKASVGAATGGVLLDVNPRTDVQTKATFALRAR
jgi:hypothetical protein